VLDAQAGPLTMADLVAALPQAPADTSFGSDIDAANEVMLDRQASQHDKERALADWLGRSQPCLFGRLAAKQDRGTAASKGLGYHLIWIDDADLRRDRNELSALIQRARRAWKDLAETGQSSALILLFNSPALVLARPGPEFARISRELAQLYLAESGGVLDDVVYIEAVPLRDTDGSLRLYKASTQLFYPGAHLRRNHDRRFPGGLAIVVNAPGHYARSLVRRGLAGSFEEAVAFVRDTASRSVGNGGIAHPCKLSSSWHHAQAAEQRGRSAELGRFAAVYQVDVLVQSSVITDDSFRLAEHRSGDIWPDLHLEYISARHTSWDDADHGWFNGVPADDPAKFHNPWLPRRAENSPSFDY
jgi:hypothetical protein